MGVEVMENTNPDRVECCQFRYSTVDSNISTDVLKLFGYTEFEDMDIPDWGEFIRTIDPTSGKEILVIKRFSDRINNIEIDYTGLLYAGVSFDIVVNTLKGIQNNRFIQSDEDRKKILMSLMDDQRDSITQTKMIALDFINNSGIPGDLRSNGIFNFIIMSDGWRDKIPDSSSTT